MKTSFNIGLVEVKNCIVSKTIFVTTFFGHDSVLSPSFQFYIKISFMQFHKKHLDVVFHSNKRKYVKT